MSKDSDFTINTRFIGKTEIFEAEGWKQEFAFFFEP